MATFGREPLQVVWMHTLTPVIGSNFGSALRQAQDCCAGLSQLHGSCNIVVGISANAGSLLGKAELRIALGEPKLGLLAISDISADANDPLRMSVTVICNEAAYLDPPNLAARTDDTKLRAIFVPLLAEGFAPGKLYSLYVLGMYAGQPFSARDLGGPLWKAVNRRIVLRNMQDFLVGIISEGANASGPASQGKQYVAFNQGLLATLALGHIDVDAYHPLRQPNFVVRNGTASLDPSDLTV